MMNPGHGLYPAMTVGEIVEVDIELESLGHAITAIWIGHPDARPVDRGSGSWFPDTHFGSSRASESLFCLALLADRFGICQDLLVRQHYLKLIPKGQDNLIRAELGKGGFPN